MPAASEEQTGDVIKGTAGSMPESITAPARVLGGPQDFGSDAAWRRAGGEYHDTRVDLAVCHGFCAW